MGIKSLVALAIAAALTTASAVASTAAAVNTLTVQPAAAEDGFEVDGAIQPVRQATVSAQVAGSVLQLAVKAGDRVKAGQIIARIDERDAAAGVQRSDAALAQAQAESANARMNAERTRDLRGKGFVSQAALDVAETQLKAALAGVQQAQAGRSQATLARGFSTVTAPFDGVVLATYLDAGDLATPGRAIATVYAPGALRAVVQVGVSRAEAARKAQRAEVLLRDGRRVTPLRRTELATADPVTQTIEWRLDLPRDAVQNLAPGQVMRVRFDRGATGPSAPNGASTIRVPAAAVLHRGELTAVYVVKGSGFVLRAVRLGADRGADGIEIVAGLRAGERIAADALKAGLAVATPAP